MLIDTKKFGVFIAAQRKEQGMTQSDLAERLHVTDKAVSRWERGMGFPDINTLEPLANALGITVMELMQAERGSTGEEAAAQAVSDTVDLARQSRVRDQYYSLVGVVCIGMAMLSLAVLGLSALPEILVFYCALAAVLIGTACMKQASDKETAAICKGVVVIGSGAAAGALMLLLPRIILERYGALIVLLCTGLMLFNLAREIMNAVQNRERMGRGKLTALVVLNLAVMVMIGFSIKVQITRMEDSTVSERVTVVQQYADALVMGRFDLGPEELTARAVTYAEPTGTYPDVFYAVYQFLDETGRKITYGYCLSLDHNFEITVTEEGETLGGAIISDAVPEQQIP